METDVEAAVACLGISTVILCRRQKERRQRKIWVILSEVVRRTAN